MCTLLGNSLILRYELNPLFLMVDLVEIFGIGFDRFRSIEGCFGLEESMRRVGCGMIEHSLSEIATCSLIALELRCFFSFGCLASFLFALKLRCCVDDLRTWYLMLLEFERRRCHHMPLFIPSSSKKLMEEEQLILHASKTHFSQSFFNLLALRNIIVFLNSVSQPIAMFFALIV